MGVQSSLKLKFKSPNGDFEIQEIDASGIDAIFYGHFAFPSLTDYELSKTFDFGFQDILSKEEISQIRNKPYDEDMQSTNFMPAYTALNIFNKIKNLIDNNKRKYITTIIETESESKKVSILEKCAHQIETLNTIIGVLMALSITETEVNFLSIYDA